MLLAQLWHIVNSATYKAVKVNLAIPIDMLEKSPIFYKTNLNHAHWNRWFWETGRLEMWINVGRPAVDLSKVIFEHEKPS